MPELAVHLSGSDLGNCKLALECIKKICKKYRFMFRSDALYIEMNYMIESLSPHLLANLVNATQQLKTTQDPELVATLLTVCNCVLHIMESILSQEELPDFYEDNLNHISTSCVYILDSEFPTP